MYYQKKYYFKAVLFRTLIRLSQKAKAQRLIVRHNRQRAYWSLVQGVSDACFYLFV